MLVKLRKWIYDFSYDVPVGEKIIILFLVALEIYALVRLWGVLK